MREQLHKNGAERLENTDPNDGDQRIRKKPTTPAEDSNRRRCRHDDELYIRTGVNIAISYAHQLSAQESNYGANLCLLSKTGNWLRRSEGSLLSQVLRTQERIKELAERVGFEPTIPVKVYTLSKRAPSATRPSLRRRMGQSRSQPGKAMNATCSL